MMRAREMGSSADENRKHPWDTVIRELVTKGEVSEDVLYDSDAIIRWWRSLDPTKQEEIKARVQELSQDVFAEVPEKKTGIKAPKKRRGGCLGCLGLIVAFIIIVVVIESSSSGDNNQQTSSTETQTTVEDSRFIYEDGGMYVRADGEPIELINNLNASNPTYAELIAFIMEDPTDSKLYLEKQVGGWQPFVCADFAEEVHNNAETKGIRAAWVSIDLRGEEIGHAFNAFETTDRGLVYVDCTGASLGERLQLSLESFSGNTPASRDCIAYVEIGKEYGCIDIAKAKLPSYSFYDEYKQKWYECQYLFLDYNEQVAQYNLEVTGKVYYIGTPECAEIEAWEVRIDDLGQLIDELREELGEFWFEPMGIVDDIRIYWGNS